MSSKIIVWDYIVVSIILLISICIGLYNGNRQRLKKLIPKCRVDIQEDIQPSSDNDNAKTFDYIIASSSMGTIPIAFSLLATIYSATSLLGFPAEVYQYGIEYWLAVFPQSLAPLFGALVTVPFLASHNVISVFEYFDMRYDRRKFVRRVGVFCYVVRNFISCAIFMYGPATCLALLANVDEKICISIIGAVGTFYTAIGGIRGVIWNDLFQAIIMYASLIIVLVKGISDVGGFSNLIDISWNGGRLNLFDFDPDPFKRQNFWSIIFGQICINLMWYCFDQQTIQRFRAAKTRTTARRALILNAPLVFILVSMCCTAGLSLYANFVGCDPLTNPNPAERIRNPNQLMGYFVLTHLNVYPGMAGLFLGAIFCASLSSVSSILSSQASILWIDFLKFLPYFQSFDDSKSLLTNKIIVLVCGIICTGLAFLVSIIGGNLTQISTALNGAFNAPLVGLFLLSMFFSIATPTGAVVGTAVGFFCSLWISLGGTIVAPVYPKLDVSVALCQNDSSTNETSMLSVFYERSTQADELTGFRKFYALSYMLYSTFSILATLLAGLVVSLFSGGLKNQQKNSFVYIDISYICFYLKEKFNNIY